MHAEATTVQFPGLDGVLPGYGVQRPNDWGLGFEIRDAKSPHWTGAHNSPGSYGHFGQSGTLIWVDPVAKLALVVLTDRDFGDWALPLWPAISDRVLAAYNSD
jgi:CubicO group peptidase (beta-lactamase class C family)